MMQRYQQALVNAGVNDYSWETFEDDYRLALITLLLVHMQWRGLGFDHAYDFIDDAIVGFERWDCQRLVK